MQSKSYRQIFFTLLFMVALMFMSNFVLYKRSVQGISRQVTETNKMVVNNVVKSFDDSFRDLNNLTYSIHTMPYDSMLEDESKGSYYSYAFWKDMAKVVNASTSNDFIEEVIAFYKQSDMAFTSTGTISLKDLFRFKYRNDDYNVMFWKSIAEKRHALQLFAAADYIEYEGNYPKHKKLIAIAGNNQLSKKNIIVLVDVDKWLGHVAQHTLLNGTSLMILDDKQNVVLSTGDHFNLLDLLHDANLHEGRQTTLQKENSEYYFYKSDYNGFTYIEKVPMQYANMNSFTKASRMILYFTIALSVVLSGVLSVFLFRPYKKIVRYLGGDSGGSHDFHHILTRIQTLREELEQNRLKIRFTEAEARCGIAVHAVQDNPLPSDFEKRAREYFHDVLDHKFLVMAGLYLPSHSAVQLQTTVADYTDALNRELQKRWAAVRVAHLGDQRYLAVFGLQHAHQRGLLPQMLRAFLKQPDTEELQGLSIKAALSRVYDSKMEHWRSAYKDIQNAMLYRNVDDNGPVYDFEPHRRNLKYYLPIVEIERLSNFFLCGNVDEGIKIVDDVIIENMKLHIHHYQFQLIVKFLFAYMLRHLEPQGEEHQEASSLLNAFLSTPDHLFEVWTVRDELIRLVRYITDKSAQTKKSKLNRAFISQYIELHYMENLYLDHMAQILDTTPKYFSNYFKKTFGVNFVEYLNKVRLSHAKEFLKNMDCSVAEIGEKTGYMNSSTFTSTFKKYVGISPSEYRKKHDVI